MAVFLRIGESWILRLRLSSLVSDGIRTTDFGRGCGHYEAAEKKRGVAAWRRLPSGPLRRVSGPTRSAGRRTEGGGRRGTPPWTVAPIRHGVSVAEQISFDRCEV